MDILNNIKPVKLRKFFNPQETLIPNPLDYPLATKDHGYHVIGRNIGDIQELISRSIIDYFNTEEDDTGIIIVFDLIYSWNERSTRYKKLRNSINPSQFERIIFIRDVTNFTELIVHLKKLKTYEFFDRVHDHETLPLNHKRLSLVIIDCISVLNLATKVNYEMEYVVLSSLINSLQAQYCCSFITSTFDKRFELGIDLQIHKNRDIPNDLKEVTAIPIQFFSNRLVYFISSTRNNISSNSMLLNGKLFNPTEKKAYQIKDSVIIL